MKLRNIINTVFPLVAVLVSMQGCRDAFQVGAGESEEVVLSLIPTDMNVQDVAMKSVPADVDEGVAADYIVRDFWLFQYDDSGVLLGAPRYYISEDYQSDNSVPVSVILPSSSDVSYKLVVIANTHDPSLLSTISYNTLTALKSASLHVSSSEDLYNTYESSYDLIMNGSADITSTTSSIDCLLYRNVAKLNLTISNKSSSGIIINSVQLRNVPDELYLASGLNSGETLFPMTTSVYFGSLEKDEINLAENAECTLTYYLPGNLRGTNSSTTPAGKNVNAPECATYVEVIGIRTATKAPVLYKFYLGANDVNDFNVEPNHLYNVDLNFAQYGDQNDNRVEDISVVLLEDSNSYIINPQAGLTVKYKVPIENRINTYWKSESGKSKSDWEKYMISSRHEWVAEVIWQDVSGKQLIEFCNEDGTLSDTYLGLSDDRYFSFMMTDEAAGVPANIVIGVRRKEEDGWTQADGYMWSWHIWLTDYDPYFDVGDWVDDKYSYEVPGGSLHRYASFDDMEMYKGAYIMDRNFGAKGYTREDGWILSAGMVYQYGRKDPFPTSDNVWGIDGTTSVSVKKSPGNISIYNSVMSPLTFLTNNVGNWTSEYTYASYSWNDLYREADNGEGKSFFDPCPPGWKLPDYHIWHMFGTKNEAYASNWASAVPADNTYATNSTDAGWMFYLRGEEKTGETAYFPGSGSRHRANGNYSGGGNGSLWSATDGGTLSARYMYYENKADYYLLPEQNFYRATGLPVRCITDN